MMAVKKGRTFKLELHQVPSLEQKSRTHPWCASWEISGSGLLFSPLLPLLY